MVDSVRAEFLVEDGELRVEESALSKQRKNISVYNTVETLNKHPSIFINYLRVLAGLKGIKFQIQAVPEEQKGQPKKKKTKANKGPNTKDGTQMPMSAKPKAPSPTPMPVWISPMRGYKPPKQNEYKKKAAKTR